ncbi:MAG TPA: zinc ribbon domain-containing protein [Terriglobales bacterium]|nr:zinc ribbon domain-containing protein [Terriglobales bacterium]
MERQCHHCGAAVPDGTPFCAACGAPQIRVIAPQSTVVPPLPEVEGRAPVFSHSNVVLPPATPIRWATAFRKCLIAGAATTFVILIAGHPLLILLALPVGGWLAVFLYARGEDHPRLTAGIGARIGAVAGLITFGFYALLMTVVLIFQKARFLEEIKNTMKTAAAQNPNPQTQQVMEKLMSPEGIAVLVSVSAVILFFVFLIMCSIGGAIGGNFAKGKNAA